MISHLILNQSFNDNVKAEVEFNTVSVYRFNNLNLNWYIHFKHIYLGLSFSAPYSYTYIMYTIIIGRGKKITCPGARDKLNYRQDKHIFSSNVLRTSKKIH